MTPAIESKELPDSPQRDPQSGKSLFGQPGWDAAGEYYAAAEHLATTLLNAGVKLLCLENIGVCPAALARRRGGAQKAWQDGVTLARAVHEDGARKRLLLRLRGIYEEARMGEQVHAVDNELRGLP